MVLDESLRRKIDEVVRRRNTAEQHVLLAEGLLGAGAAYAVTRILLGVLTGGQGLVIALGVSIAAGLTRSLTYRRIKHTRLGAARYIDHHLNLADRLATAVEQSAAPATDTQMLDWLGADAGRCAPAISPPQLVPYRIPTQAKLLAALLVLCIFVSLPIYPRGLSWQIGSATTAQVTARAQELLALADQLAEFDDPAMAQVAAELRQIGTDLQNNLMPANQARSLLQELEKEFQHSENPSNTSIAGIDMAQLQSFAESLRTVTGKLPQGQTISDYMAGGNSGAAGSSQAGQSGQTSQSNQSGSNSDSDTDTSNSNHTGSGNSPASAAKQQTEGNSGTGGNTDDADYDTNEYGSEGYGNQGSSDSASANNSPGANSSPGTGTGENGLQPYDRQAAASSQTKVDGSLGADGQLYSTTASGTFLPKGEFTGLPGSSTTVFATGLEGAVTQESIPAAYRYWIKLYFEALESGANTR